ncbi:MAG: DMT family transporter [Patescibacteria group bacterium]|nr:DMT family transporter [Patescibacteria group bacterium]
MPWLIFAFSGPVLWAASTHIDKYLVEKYFKYGSVAVLMVFTAIIGLLLLPFIWWFKPQVLNLPFSSILVMALSGILYMAAILFYLQALQTEEASAVAPFYQAAPLFAYALAYIVLGETLSRIQIFGGLLIVGGAVLLSVRFGGQLKRIRWRLIILMLSCAFVLALSSVIFKFFAIRDDFWNTTFWTYVGEAVFGVFILAIPSYFRQFIKMLKSNTSAVLGVNGANELINLGGSLGVRYAIILAPLSLVQAISSTTTLFVFVFGIFLTIFFPSLAKEDLSVKSLAQKGFAALIIALGVILISQV